MPGQEPTVFCFATSAEFRNFRIIIQLDSSPGFFVGNFPFGEISPDVEVYFKNLDFTGNRDRFLIQANLDPEAPAERLTDESGQDRRAAGFTCSLYHLPYRIFH